MENKSGTVCVLKLDGKYMGKNKEIVKNIKDALLIHLDDNGILKSAAETLMFYGLSKANFESISFEEVVPSYYNEFWDKKNNGYMGLSCVEIRNLAHRKKTLRDALPVSLEDDENDKEL